MGAGSSRRHILFVLSSPSSSLGENEIFLLRKFALLDSSSRERVVEAFLFLKEVVFVMSVVTIAFLAVSTKLCVFETLVKLLIDMEGASTALALVGRGMVAAEEE